MARFVTIVVILMMAVVGLRVVGGPNVSLVPDPQGTIKPEFSDLSIGVLLTTSTSGTLLESVKAYDSLFVDRWKKCLDSTNGRLLMSAPDAQWNGPLQPAMVYWQCAPPIRTAWNSTSRTVKDLFYQALRDYHAAVWEGEGEVPRDVDCQVVNMQAPQLDPGKSFSGVAVQRIPATGPITTMRIVLTYP